MNGKMLGKIASADVTTEYGHLYLTLEFSGGGENNWGCANSYTLRPGPKASYPEEWKIFDLAGLMETAKVERVQQLKNKPVEVTFENNVLKDFRILTEVL